MAIRIAIVGYGKIAEHEHEPAIRADGRFALAAVATRGGDPGVGVPWFATPSELFATAAGSLDAVAICTPALVRHAIASEALAAGLHVLLEKPPAATLGEIEDLERLAAGRGRTLYAAWHSQHAAGVAAAAEALRGTRVTELDIAWLEDVRKWHPGQEWIWAPGGFGVFDAGINALSIATRILPGPLLVREARLLVPANKQTPIAAELSFEGGALRARLDWRSGEDEQWSVRMRTADGKLVELRDGGARLSIDGAERTTTAGGEYPPIYDRFAALIAGRGSEVDREPLRIVADAFLVGRREPVEPFL